MEDELQELENARDVFCWYCKTHQCKGCTVAMIYDDASAEIENQMDQSENDDDEGKESH